MTLQGASAKKFQAFKQKNNHVDEGMHGMYLLVNCPIAMDNHHFLWLNQHYYDTSGWSAMTISQLNPEKKPHDLP